MHSTEPLPEYVKTFCRYITPKRTDSEVYRRRRRGRGWGGGEGGVGGGGGRFSLGVYVSRESNSLQEQNNLACIKMSLRR